MDFELCAGCANGKIFFLSNVTVVTVRRAKRERERDGKGNGKMEER